MKIINGILTFFGIIILFLVTMFLPPVLVIRNLENVVFDREKVWQTLEDTVLSQAMYEEMRTEVLEGRLTGEGGGSFVSDALASMDESEAAEFWDLVLPYDALITMIHQPFDGFYDWFAGDALTPDGIVIDSTPIMETISNNKSDIFQMLVATMTDCTDAEVKLFAAALSEEENPTDAQSPFCKMPPAYAQQQADSTLSQFDLEDFSSESSTIPIELNMTEAEAIEIKNDINLVRMYAKTSLWALMAAWLVGGLLKARSGKGALRAFASPALIGGAMTIVFGYILRIGGSLLTAQMLNRIEIDVPASILHAVEQLIKTLTAQMADPVILHGGLLLAAAVLAFIMIPLLPKKRVEEDLPVYKQET